ncbi:MAG: UDP-N-acetylglucosamine--N-acetylmuramyl-(pentapeptide) pyrophosphoryl-undecaprenol [Pseudomonadota bacterium]|jgi:UDP-N-acetylglucosamine--N-acetylmuramyl-(pentapeptide) pyrophosphoryl-undecaprenol N-acetylglucosamine transferase
MKKIFIIGGGTGGHLFPAISIAEQMLKRNYDVHLITDTRCLPYLKNYAHITTHIINSSGFKSSSLDMLKGIFQIILAIFRTAFLFLKEKPNFVIGFGGYTPFPSLFLAKILSIPFAIHEQNAFLGKTNKWFAPYANYVFLTSDNTSNIPQKCNKSKLILSGNPVRNEIKNAIPTKKRNFNSEPFSILVLGGSQGAKIFSELVPTAIQILKKSHPEIGIKITQQAKNSDIPKIQKIYNEYSVANNIADFFYNIPELILDSHIVIARSGASTIAELIALSQPSILVPYPFAAEKHQHFNAKVLAKSGGGWWFDQEELTPDILAKKLYEIACNRNVLDSASQSLKYLKIDSVNKIADTIEKIIT